MPFRKLSDWIDEKYPPGTQERRDFDYYGARTRRIARVSGGAYRLLIRVPPRWSTAEDEYIGKTNWVGVGPVAAQFWSDILEGLLWRHEAKHNKRLPYRDDEKKGRGYGDIFYSALDGLAWRFFDDEYIPTWSDVKSGRSGKDRLVWRLRRRQAVEVAEHYAAEASDELKDRGVDS